MRGVWKRRKVVLGDIERLAKRFTHHTHQKDGRQSLESLQDTNVEEAHHHQESAGCCYTGVDSVVHCADVHGLRDLTSFLIGPPSSMLQANRVEYIC